MNLREAVPPAIVATALARGGSWLALAAAVVVGASSIAKALARPDWLDGRDFELYRDATSRWLGGGPFYEPYQLAGPYPLAHGDVLYPPVALVGFAPFTVLPSVLWWAIPLTVTAIIVWQRRPSILGWAAIILAATWAPTLVKVSTGNPVIWIVAAVALGVRFGWPAAFVLIKPTLAPFAVLGIRKPAWWLALGGLGIASALFGSMWLDWVTALTNVRGTGLYYSVAELPMVAIPVIADLFSRRTPKVDQAEPVVVLTGDQILSTQ